MKLYGAIDLHLQAQGKLRKKSFSDPPHLLWITGLGPSLCVLARVNLHVRELLAVWKFVKAAKTFGHSGAAPFLFNEPAARRCLKAF